MKLLMSAREMSLVFERYSTYLAGRVGDDGWLIRPVTLLLGLSLGPTVSKSVFEVSSWTVGISESNTQGERWD